MIRVVVVARVAELINIDSRPRMFSALNEIIWRLRSSKSSGYKR